MTVVRVAARGATGVAQVLSLVTLGDIVSVRLAELSAIDPTPVAAITSLKASLE